uniref:NAD(+) diphosphatase n=1 Tax=Chaetoceros debilis TaxID=122233 RepID=A0A7S3PZ20_9STRA|mmetsp:Transcript_20552/g.31188  ORF Transcript_20552/g.31188 Transcript_20552/m.31188 type:complete len:427 (+) Transcript_20552:63-1343(+)
MLPSAMKNIMFIAIALATRSSGFMSGYARKVTLGSRFLSKSKERNRVSNHLLNMTPISSSEKIDKSIWYTDPNLSRSLVATDNMDSARFILVSTFGDRKTTCHLHGISDEGEIIPTFLDFSELKALIGENEAHALSSEDNISGTSTDSSILIWIGERDKVQYFAAFVPTSNDVDENALKEKISGTLGHRVGFTPHLAPLREFGDRISESADAAVHSTANGLVEFHKTHRFCPSCGSPTIVRKVGSSRLCSNHRSLEGSCQSSSLYPRIDVASIMLVTSPCSKYALLGRKASWPQGRYSTLAGFLEVGETVEDCCIRETLEESGIRLDRTSIEFRKSQPWPFPRSVMVGFRAKAVFTNDDSETLPRIDFDEKEMEDVQWFEKSYVRERLAGGSTALMYNPTEEEMEFHIPGKASLARALITEWAIEK